MDPLLATAGVLRFLALGILPGYAVAFALFPRSARDPGFHGLALALGPPLLGVTAALTQRGAPALVVTIAALAFGTAVLRRRRVDGPGPDAAPGAAFLGPLLVTLLCAAIPAGFEWWRVSSDAWTHEGIVRTLLRDGVPPGDPWYAGLTLHYAWIYHAAVGTLLVPGGPDVFVVMSALAVVSALSVTLSVSALAARWNPGARGWTFALVVLGLNALFPLFLPLQAGRALTGESRGVEALARVFDLTPFGWDTVGAFLRGLGGQDFFLNKFLVATPLSLALAAWVAWIATVDRTVRERGPVVPLALAAFALTSAGGLLHPVVGIALASVGGLLGLAALVAFRGAARARLVAVLGASGLGVLAFGLYIVTFVRTGEGGHAGPPLDLDPLKLLGLGTCLALGLLFALPRVTRELRGTDEGRLRAGIVLATLLVAILIRLPGPSPFFTVDKFSYLAWFPVALAAGAGFARFVRARGPLARAALVLLLFVPVNGLALVSRIVDPRAASRQPWAHADLAWMRAQLPADAVLLVPPGDIDLGVFAQRDQYYGIDADAQLRGYAPAEMEARKGMIMRLFTEEPLSVDDTQRLRALGRPVYAVWTDYRDPFWEFTPGSWSKRFTSPRVPARWASFGPALRSGTLTVVPVVPPDSTRAMR